MAASGSCSCHGKGWNKKIFKVPSTLIHSGILGIFSLKKKHFQTAFYQLCKSKFSSLLCDFKAIFFKNSNFQQKRNLGLFASGDFSRLKKFNLPQILVVFGGGKEKKKAPKLIGAAHSLFEQQHSKCPNLAALEGEKRRILLKMDLMSAAIN